jgi:hypothetical protein
VLDAIRSRRVSQHLSLIMEGADLWKIMGYILSLDADFRNHPEITIWRLNYDCQ